MMDLNDSNFKGIEVKPEPTLVPKFESFCEYSHVEVDDKNAKNCVKVKEENYVDASIHITEMDVAVTQNTGIACNNMKIKIDIDNEDVSKASYWSKPGGQESIFKNDLETLKIKLFTPPDLSHSKKLAEEKRDIFKKNGSRNSSFMKLHVDGNSHKCEIRKRCLQKKQYTHTDEGNFKCDICTKLFAKRAAILRHMKIHTNERNYKCEICCKCFKAKKTLMQHIETHTGDRNYKCDICSKCFTKKHNLTHHMEIHATERNYKCEICLKCFTTIENLSKHFKIHTSERIYKCEICAKRFKTKRTLLQHVETHTGEKNYKCEICTKCFMRKGDLLQHVQIHSDGRNYKCEICTKCTITKDGLLKHMKMHTGERNYICEVCTKCFTTKPYLLQHTKIHTNERNYRCKMCTKSFTTKQYQYRHMKRHTSERSCRCEICSISFTTKHNLLIHMKTHIDKRNYKCGNCSLCFEKRKTLLEHKKSHTEEVDEEKSDHKFQCNVQSKTDERSIIEETKFIKEETLEIGNDISERKWLVATSNDGHIDASIKEEKPRSPNLIHLWQALNNDIMIKEEENVAVSKSFMDIPDIIDVKQEILNT